MQESFLPSSSKTGMFTRPSSGLAVSATIFALLFSISAVSSMTWTSSGAGTCGLFNCCDTSGSCEAIHDVFSKDKVKSRFHGVAAMLLISIIIHFITAPVTMVAASKGWAGGLAMGAVVLNGINAFFLWLGFFIAGGNQVGMSGNGITWCMYSAVLSLSAVFLSIHCKGTGSGGSDASGDESGGFGALASMMGGGQAKPAPPPAASSYAAPAGYHQQPQQQQPPASGGYQSSYNAAAYPVAPTSGQ